MNTHKGKRWIKCPHCGKRTYYDPYQMELYCMSCGLPISRQVGLDHFTLEVVVKHE